MTLPGRRLKKYHPRRSRYTVRAQKQQLADFEHKLSAHLGALLVLIQNGSSEQIQSASLHIQSDLHKYGPEMASLAKEMKGSFPKAVDEYLHAITTVAQSALGWIDEQKISGCYSASQKLQELIKH